MLFKNGPGDTTADVRVSRYRTYADPPVNYFEHLVGECCWQTLLVFSPICLSPPRQKDKLGICAHTRDDVLVASAGLGVIPT